MAEGQSWTMASFAWPRLTLCAFLAAALGLALLGAGDLAGAQALRSKPRRVVDVDARELAALLLRQPDVPLVNVHVPYEGEIEGTDLHVPFDQVEANLWKFPADRAAPLVVYCMSGRMSTIATETLVRLGYTNIVHLEGGMLAWDKAGYPLIRWRR